MEKFMYHGEEKVQVIFNVTPAVAKTLRRIEWELEILAGDRRPAPYPE